ncbi:F-box protein pp2-a15 [Thalictrum thalictroides]|uniref:F-box protein pp2-a15 n=1 Tax=Thalictrum thalictroides TaxID=46969 RepID=A0A7J6WL48_THATH|nr:F-box protein pp2-a15 [Thalictrum thalictroides]
MGASLSNLTTTYGTSDSSSGRIGLGDIPENCVACVFMYLTPPEICNLARLNRAFRGAASSDSVWESKLPSNYLYLLHLLHINSTSSLSKKDIFALLSRPLPFDDHGNKDFWLDRVTGGVCMSISAKAMSITGIEDRRYWNWIPTDESRFHVIAYLQQIWWFELDGAVKFPFPAGVYTLSFRLHLGRFSRRLGRRVCRFEHTHGWEIKPVRFELSTSDGQQASCEVCLDEPDCDDTYTNHKRGCWIDYKVGEFVVNESEAITEVRFSMKQIDCTHSKGGLCVDAVFIVPSGLKGRRRRDIMK